VVIGKDDANSLPVKSRPFASTVTFGSGAFIESKNGSTVTVDLFSKRMISFSPIWTRVIFSFEIEERSSL
jgi:hypothetical protein